MAFPELRRPSRLSRRAKHGHAGCGRLLLVAASAVVLFAVGAAASLRVFRPPTALPSPTLSPTPVVVTAVPPTATPPAERLLSIPALNLNRHIVEVPIRNGAWQIDQLDQDVGHLAGTAPPGEVGNAVIVGHITLADNREGPFIHLAELPPDSPVIVQQGGHRFIYTVQGARVVGPNDMSVVGPTDYPLLTLLTCTGWDVATQHYTQRLIVLARLARVE